MKIPVEDAARLLSYCSHTTQSVTQLTSGVERNHQDTVDLARELADRGLLERTVKNVGRGRPRHALRTTRLGMEFIDLYEQLLDLRLLSDANDIKRARRSADLTTRLVEAGLDPYTRFQEMNDLARNISSTAQGSAKTRGTAR